MAPVEDGAVTMVEAALVAVLAAAMVDAVEPMAVVVTTAVAALEAVDENSVAKSERVVVSAVIVSV